MSDSEETSLLPAQADHDLIYQRYSRAEKRFLVAVVSCSLEAFVSGTFLPSIPQIAAELQTTGATVSYAVSLSVLATFIGPLIGTAYAAYYGKRVVYLVGFPVSIAGSLGVWYARTVPQLMFWRFFQSAGAAPGMALGAGVIGDIYKLEERGTALGIFFGATLVGPALAPFVGGFTTHYFSWRILQLGLGVFALIGFIFVLFAFTETSHPGALKIESLEPNSRPRWRPVLINPLAPLGLLRSPSLFALTMVGLVVLLTDYVLLVPLAYTIGIRYNIRNEALLGACYLPSGLGNIVGAPVAGGLSDRVVKKWKSKRGFLYPEDRLRACFIGASVLVPLSILLSGLSIRYIPGPIGLVLNLLFLFMNGFGVDMVLGPSAAYIVDILQTRSAEAMAANSGLRAFLLSFAVAGILPMINAYGIVLTNLISALLAWAGLGLLVIIIKHGERMRKWVDVGYSI
ncbi:hypothetical protein D9756_008813 [Leucocoprinus leucothites]|uniref:Major facilitator superfamily (MFS) profile domain-containing protein n=1 Tax=Leucocoprinus leucothites TaxID=201217 RepID=A0A8H5CXC3_9AGAR|nr:hypothetical protein D9756_008813 [Leucoagaricus leucothites]